jgi:hypothetical protein
MLLLEKKPENWKTGGNREKTKKNLYFTEIEPYLYEFDAIESRFGIYTQKTIWQRLQNTLRLISCVSTE